MQQRLKQIKGRLRRSAEEHEKLAEIGRIISSSPSLDQVFEEFASKVRNLVPFDRMAISVLSQGLLPYVRVAGVQVPELACHKDEPLEGSVTFELVHTRGSLSLQTDHEDVLCKHWPARYFYKAGLFSWLAVPLIYGDKVVGALHLQSFRRDAYQRRDIDLAERVALQAAGAVATAQLYADLKKAEQEAQWERQRLQCALETAPVGILVLDARQRVLLANREMERIFGFVPIPGETMDRYTAAAVYRRPGGAECSLLVLQQAIAAGQQLLPQEVRMEFPDGRKVPALVNVSPARAEDDAVAGAILTVQDMSGLDQALTARREFLGIVSHEMRTPLTIIKGSVLTALHPDRPIDPEEARELFQVIDDEADKLKDLIDNLLDINRIESGTLSIRPEPLDLKTVLAKVQACWTRMAGVHRLVINTPEHLPLALGDRDRIAQVLLNLIDNAGKFSSTSAPITIQVEPGPTHVTVHVHDKGVGIPRDKVTMLFRKFTRLHLGGVAPAQGTGLGLAICKGIVEAHGGRIWAQSPGEGRGSTFSFTLPVAD